MARIFKEEQCDGLKNMGSWIRPFILTGFSSHSLGPLVGKVKEYQVETIVDTLCTNMLSDKEQLRDISSMGLKTVISELPPAATGTLSVPVCH